MEQVWKFNHMTIWLFDVIGNGFQMEFSTIEEAIRFAQNHGLQFLKRE